MISLLSAPPPVPPHHPALDETMEGEEQGTLRTPTRSGRGEGSLRRLRRTGRRGCGFAECTLGGRRHHGRRAALRRAEAHHTRHHRRLEPPHAAACHTHITLDRRLHRTGAARSSRGECPMPCDATTARSSSPTTHAPLLRISGSRRKPLRPSSRSANPSSSVHWAHFPTTCLSFCRAFAATM